MKPIWILVLGVLFVGNIAGGYLLYKAIKLRDETRMLHKIIEDLTRKNRDLTADYAGLSVYAEQNRELLASTTPEERKQMCVLYGASITKGFNADSLVPGHKFINRGVGAQSSTQLLARFSSDVLQLQPGRVVIKICAGNFSPNVDSRMIWDEFETMALTARARGIEPIVATIIPVTRRGEEYPGYSMNEETRRFNARAREFARQHGFKVVDYYAVTSDLDGFLPDDMARDAIHPNAIGYAKMAEAFRATMH
ncbi:MAG: GDSL-type esterase/lipase family protein [Candidatus Zixiibacteriota bacterium]